MWHGRPRPRNADTVQRSRRLLFLSPMPRSLNPELRRAVAERLRFYNELGIYDFYRRDVPGAEIAALAGLQDRDNQPESGDEMSPRKSAAVAKPVAVEESVFQVIVQRPEQGVGDPAKALKMIREDLGDCTRCALHKQGRKQIVFGVGNPNAELLFVGEGPGADEDEQGEPFVGRAGQLLTRIIEAIDLKRDDVYIANVIKCRPPQNRNPEPDEVDTCEPFLFRQIDVIKPKVIVALGTFAARTLLKTVEPISRLRGRVFEYRGAK